MNIDSVKIGADGRERRGGFRCLSAAVSAILSFAAASAQAGPVDGRVTAGAATISTPAAHLTQIDQSSRSASIDWRSFDLAAHERVIFNQPSSASATLNRIHAQDPSQIHGGITANGRVFLINPNGVIFGATARINVGALVASSLELTDVDAESGRYAFASSGDSGAIINRGSITAADGGSVTLLGGSVLNDGLIVANFGSVNLGAGRAATLDFAGDGLMRFQVDAGLLSNASGDGAAVDNRGQITADGGQVLLTARQAGDVIARAVNNDGVIRAARVENVGGVIRLVGHGGGVVNAGTLDASGVAGGGEVQVLGEQVELTNTAVIDVSGGAGGGSAFIGGSFRGADAAILNSQRTKVQEGAAIRADALVNGDAGQVAVWSDGTTTFDGEIFARALGVSGDGGFAEVSGREHLSITGHASLQSTHGSAGTLLIDPGSITIVDGPDDGPSGDRDVVNDDWVISQLDDSNVIIETDDSLNDADEDLVVANGANITWSNNRSLTLRGDDSVTLATGSVIANTSGGALILASGGAVNIDGGVTLATGDLTIDAGGNITQTAVLDIGGASSFTTAGGQSVVLNAANSFGGPVSIAADGGILQSVTLFDSSALDLQGLAVTGDLTVNAGGGITQSGALEVGGAASFTVGGNQSILLGDADNEFDGAVSIAASAGNVRNLTLADSSALELQALAITGDLEVASGESLTQAGALIVQGDSRFSADGAGQSIVLGNAGNSFAQTVRFTANDDVAVTAASALNLQTSTVGGDFDVTARGPVLQSGALTVIGQASFRTLNDAGAAITLNGGNRFGSVEAAVRNASDTANAAGDIFIQESDDTTIGNVQTGVGRSVVINSAGAITAMTNTAVTTSQLSMTAGGAIGDGGAPISVAAPDGTISAVGSGSVRIAHTGGGVVALNQIVAGGAGGIEFVSDGGIRVADVRAGGDVSLTATGGSILDDNLGGAGSQLVANDLVLQAAGSIGDATPAGMLDLQTASLAADAQGGGLYVEQAQGDLNLRTLTAAGPIAIQAMAGSILDDPGDGAAASIASTAGGVQLRALNTLGSVDDVAARQGDALAVNTNGGALSAQVTAATGQINLAVAGGAFTAGAGAISAGGAGRLLLQSTGDLSLAALGNAITGFDEVGLSAAATLHLPDAPSALLGGPLSTLLIRGGVDVVGTSRAFNLEAEHLVFESGAAGGDVSLNTNVDALDAIVGGAASLSVIEGTGALTLGAVSAGGDVSVRAASIRDDGDLAGATRISAGNAISLHADIGVGAPEGVGGGRLDTESQSVAILADSGSVFISHVGDLQVSGAAGNGSIDITAATGDITVSSVLRASSSLSLSAGDDAGAVTGNITLAGAAQTDGVLRLTARGGGAILDGADSSTHAAAAQAVLSGSQIGADGNALNVDVGSLSATGSNGVFIDAASALQVGSIAGANIVISAVGGLTDDGDAQTRIAGGSVTLSGASIGASGNAIQTSVDRVSANASTGGVYIGELGDVALAAVTAGSGADIVITASGALADDGDQATRVRGGHVSLTAASIGAGAAGQELDTQASSLTATASNGGIYIGEANDLQLNSITATGDSVVLAAAGVLSDDGDNTTRVTGDNVSLTGSAAGAANSRIDTAANVLAITADAGIYIDEIDDVTLADVRLSGANAALDVRTANDGDITVQNLVTQGGTVNLTAGGAGSLNVTGALESNNGVVNLTSGDVLAVPGLNTGTGSATLRTVNDANVGSITASSISITSDTGSVFLGTANAGTGVVTITANNGAIVDNTATSVTAGQATLSARSIGSADNPLNMAVDELTADASAGGVFIDDAGGLLVHDVRAAGAVSLTTSGAFSQAGAITSAGNSIAVFASNIDMASSAITRSDGADITYVANSDNATLAVLEAADGRIILIAADDVFSSLGGASATTNLSGSSVEVRAGGLAPGSGQIGTVDSPLAIATPTGVGRNVFLIVPAANGIQRTTPHISYAGSAASVLLKGYTGSGGALLFDLSSTFTSDPVLLNGESIVPLLNGRVAVNTESLSAAKQALSSGVISRANIDWAAFDPDVSLFGTLDPALRLPADQLDEALPIASLLAQ